MKMSLLSILLTLLAVPALAGDEEYKLGPDSMRQEGVPRGTVTKDVWRSGHVYPSLIRSTPNKPIRVFLQDGSGDLDNQFGNWWLANLEMESALKYKKYDYKFVGGTGKHSGKHGGAILPDSLRWLWRNAKSPAADK